MVQHLTPRTRATPQGNRTEPMSAASTTPGWLARPKPSPKRQAPPPDAPTAPPATQAPASHVAAATPAESTAKPPKARGGNPSGPQAHVAGRLTSKIPVFSDLEALSDRVVAISARPEVADALRPDMPAVLSAMIRTAQLPGPMGMGAQATLFRLAGVKLDDKGGGKGSKDEHLATLDRIASRLERAAGMRARVVDQAERHDDDTADAAEPLKVAGNLAFDD